MATQSRRDKQKQEERRGKAQAWASQQQRGSGKKYLKLPDGIEEFKLTPGVIEVDVMPYRVGQGNKRADEGEVHFEREFEVHGIPTPSATWGEKHLCSWACFRNLCPGCDFRNETKDADLQKALRPQTRHLFLFNDKPGNAKNKPKVFDIHHYQRGTGFPELLVDAINAWKNPELDISDLRKGVTLRLTVKDQPMGDSGSRPGVTRIDFVERDYKYPDDLIDKMPCLDEMLVQTSDEDMSELLGTSTKHAKRTESNGEAGSKSKGRTQEDEDEQDDEDSDVSSVVDEDDEDSDVEDSDVESKAKAKGGKKKLTEAEAAGIEVGMFVTFKEKGKKALECEVKRISPDGSSLTLEDEDGETIRGVDPAECTPVKVKSGGDEDEEDEDDSDVEPPKSRAGKGGKKPSRKEEDEDDDVEDSDVEDDEDESPLEDSDVEPPARGKGGKKSSRKARDDDSDVEGDDD